MVIIASDIIINIDNIEAIYVQNGNLCCEVPGGTYVLANVPDDALAQIAVALAEHKSFIEFESAQRMRG